MAESVDYKKIKELVEKYDKKLLATDKRFNRSVKIVHEDGSVLCFDRAFLMKKTVKHTYVSRAASSNFTEWLIIFTEHHGTHMYDTDELTWYGQFERIHNDIKELK